MKIVEIMSGGWVLMGLFSGEHCYGEDIVFGTMRVVLWRE